jgi:hypothetical protein
MSAIERTGTLDDKGIAVALCSRAEASQKASLESAFHP